MPLIRVELFDYRMSDETSAALIEKLTDALCEATHPGLKEHTWASSRVTTRRTGVSAASRGRSTRCRPLRRSSAGSHARSSSEGLASRTAARLRPASCARRGQRRAEVDEPDEHDCDEVQRRRDDGDGERDECRRPRPPTKRRVDPEPPQRAERGQDERGQEQRERVEFEPNGYVHSFASGTTTIALVRAVGTSHPPRRSTPARQELPTTTRNAGTTSARERSATRSSRSRRFRPPTPRRSPRAWPQTATRWSRTQPRDATASFRTRSPPPTSASAETRHLSEARPQVLPGGACPLFVVARVARRRPRTAHRAEDARV